jgi:hypothetical protein
MYPFLGELEMANLAQLITTLIVGLSCFTNCLFGPRFGG